MIRRRQREPTRTPSIVSTVDLHGKALRIITEPTEDGSAFLTLVEGGRHDGEEFLSKGYQTAHKLHRQLDRWASLVSDPKNEGPTEEAGRLWRALGLRFGGQGP